MSAPATDPASFVRAELRALREYTLADPACRWKLDQNESPWELPRAVKERALRALLAEPWARYPDFHAGALRRRLGALHRWPADGVLVGNGSNELLAVALLALTPPGGEVLGAEPCFGLYRPMVLAAGGEPRFLAPRADLQLPFAELLAEVERDPRRPLLLASPNNPTGAALSADAVEALLGRLQAPLLLDNAYGELCRHDYRPLLARHPNLLLFRTLSKAWALGGIRVGYLLADPRLVAELRKVKLPYNLGRAGEAIAEAALQAGDSARRRVRVLVARRDGWAAMLRRHGLEVFPSDANFLLVRCGDGEAGRERAARLRAGLQERGIRVRDVGGAPGLEGCLRVAVGGGAALRAVDRALAELPAAVEVTR